MAPAPPTADGIRVACTEGMWIKVLNPVSGRRARIEARTLSKVFHLAGFHGWSPERIDSPPPQSPWDTEIVLPYVAPYLSGSVSFADAAALAGALKQVLTAEGSSLPSELYLAVLGLAAIAEGGGFELKPEIAWLDEVELQWPPADVADRNPTGPFAERHAIGLGAGRKPKP